MPPVVPGKSLTKLAFLCSVVTNPVQTIKFDVTKLRFVRRLKTFAPPHPGPLCGTV